MAIKCSCRIVGQKLIKKNQRLCRNTEALITGTCGCFFCTLSLVLPRNSSLYHGIKWQPSSATRPTCLPDYFSDCGAGHKDNLWCWFLCFCSSLMEGRQLKVVFLLETWFCLLTVSPRRAWTTWRLRTRSRAALATSASHCRSKPCTRTHCISIRVCARLYHNFTCERKWKNIYLHHNTGSKFLLSRTPRWGSSALHLKLMLFFPLNHRQPTHRQMFTVVEGVNHSSYTQ